MMDKLTALFSVIPVSETTIASALALRWKDFEDAVQYTAATENGVDCIVTRNAADYEMSGVPCMSPADFIAHFSER
jgi:predicted nucleic acid-binding protein